MQDIARQSNNSYMRHILTSPDIYTYQIYPNNSKGMKLIEYVHKGSPLKFNEGK